MNLFKIGLVIGAIITLFRPTDPAVVLQQILTGEK